MGVLAPNFAFLDDFRQEGNFSTILCQPKIQGRRLSPRPIHDATVQSCWSKLRDLQKPKQNCRIKVPNVERNLVPNGDGALRIGSVSGVRFTILAGKI